MSENNTDEELTNVDPEWDEPDATDEVVAEPEKKEEAKAEPEATAELEVKAESEVKAEPEKKEEAKAEKKEEEVKDPKKEESEKRAEAVRNYKIGGKEKELTQEQVDRIVQQQEPIQSALAKLKDERAEFEAEKAERSAADEQFRLKEEKLLKNPLGYAQEMGADVLAEANKIQADAAAQQNMTDAQRAQYATAELNKYKEALNSKLEAEFEAEKMLEAEEIVKTIEEEGMAVMKEAKMKTSDKLIDFYIGIADEYYNAEQKVTPQQILDEMEVRSKDHVETFVKPLSDEAFYSYLKATGIGERYGKLHLEHIKGKSDTKSEEAPTSKEAKEAKAEAKREKDWAAMHEGMDKEDNNFEEWD